MKKTFFLKIPVLGLIFAGVFLFASSSNISAQSIEDPLYAEDSGPFVLPGAAIQRLDAKLLELKIAMSQMNPSSNQYKNAELVYIYYDSIRYLLSEQKETTSYKVTSRMINKGLDIYANHTITYQQKLANKQSAIALLKS